MGKGTQEPEENHPRPGSVEDRLTLGQKLSAGLFVAWVGIGSLDVAWYGFPGLSAEIVYAGSVALGVLTGLLWIKRRYRVAGILGGAVAGFTSPGLTIFALERSESASKLAMLGAVFLGALPGIAVILAIKWIQDQLFPPRA
jgi:hypothetical protein